MGELRPGLGQVQLKLARARRHLGKLEKEIRAYDARHTFTGTPVQEARGVRLHMRILEEPDPEWDIDVSEFLYQLRSALDQLVAQLAWLHGADPVRHAGTFPIVDDERAYRADSRKGKSRRDVALKGLPEDVKVLVDAFQPFHNHAPQWHPLRRLHTAQNADKHRAGQPPLTVIRSVHLPRGGVFEPVLTFGEEDDQRVARGMAFSSGEMIPLPGVYLNPRDDPALMVRCGVVFGPTRLAPYDLPKFLDYVEVVVAEFEPLLRREA